MNQQQYYQQQQTVPTYSAALQGQLQQSQTSYSNTIQYQQPPYNQSYNTNYQYNQSEQSNCNPTTNTTYKYINTQPNKRICIEQSQYNNNTSLQQQATTATTQQQDYTSVYPVSFVAWLEKSLTNVPIELKQDTEQFLTLLISKHTHQQSFNTVDWNKQPLAHILMKTTTLAQRINNNLYKHPNTNVDTIQSTPTTQLRHQLDQPHIHTNNNASKHDKGNNVINLVDDDNYDNTSNLNVSPRSKKNKNKKKNKKNKHKDKVKDNSNNTSQPNNNTTVFATKQQQQQTNNSILSPSGLPKSNKFTNTNNIKSNLQPRTIGINYSVFSTVDNTSDNDDNNVIDIDDLQPVVGTSTTLEKQYLRLTSSPQPDAVRPLHILKQSYDYVLQQWHIKHDYHYLVDQFKSIRQDLTVQHIINDFTVLVYETHSRICIEVGDMSEFNQCQTQLFKLYNDNNTYKQHYYEFITYRILYNIVMNNKSGMSQTLLYIYNNTNNIDIYNKHIQNALNIYYSLNICNYVRYFELCNTLEYLGLTLISRMFNDTRYTILCKLIKSYKPTRLSIDYVSKCLGFTDNDVCIEYVVSCNAGLTDDKQSIDTKLCHTLNKPDNTKNNTNNKGVTHSL